MPAPISAPIRPPNLKPVSANPAVDWISPDMPPCATPWTPIPRPKPAIAPPEAGWPRWWRWANDPQTPLEWKARILMELASYVYPKTYRCLKKRSEINKLCNILWTAAIQERRPFSPARGRSAIRALVYLTRRLGFVPVAGRPKCQARANACRKEMAPCVNWKFVFTAVRKLLIL